MRPGLALCAGLLLALPSPAADQPRIDFARDVLPLLKDRCYQCHDANKHPSGLRLDLRAGALHGGDSGKPAVVPGDSGKSELVRRVTAADKDFMPPKGDRLTAAQVQTLSDWIDGGAVWPDALAGEDTGPRHWAFRPPLRPPLPAVKDAKWPRSDLDRFVLARLDKEGLAPSPEADKTTLIRRLSLDLIGLPPTPEEVDDFLNDPSPDAYEKVVDRLLASPHYGERWGRHWLDAARYADSDGYEKDKPRFVWFYRDWVVNALNRDLPYDRFIIEQLAGDLLPNPTQDQLVATGYLRNSMINEEGGVDPEQFRMDAMFDRMDAVGKGVLGMTIQCAQCHDHKFDPLTQKEYYRLFAFLNNDYEANVTVYSAEEQKKRAEVLQKVREGEDSLRKLAPDWRSRMEAWEETAEAGQPEWTVLRPEVEGETTGGQKYLPLADGSFLAQGYAPTKHTVKMKVKTDVKNVTAFRLELLNDPNLPRGGPGRSIQGTAALSEFAVEAEAGGKVEHLKFAKATADYNPPETPLDPMYEDKSGKKRLIGPVAFAIDGNNDTAWATDGDPGRRNQPHQAVFTLDKPLANADGTTLTILLTQNGGGWNSDDNQNHNLGRFRLSLTTAPAAEADPVPAAVRQTLATPGDKRTPEQEAAVFSYWRTTVAEWADANKRIEDLWKEHPEGSTQLVLRPRDQPRDTHLLQRGNFLKPGQVVEPGVPTFLNPLPAGTPPNRLTLAQWLVDRKAPTTARAAVNRVWQAYFGTGLVATPEDLGMQSEPPSHPELLDWLAVEFMDQGWSQKKLHRLIVTSATYRQASKATPELRERDPFNRLLARGPRFRVEAEVVRDVALAAGGLLNPRVGGPPIHPPLPEYLFQPPVSYGPKVWAVEKGPERFRRSLYVFRYRSVPHPVLQTFDAPNGDFACVRRGRTDTPLQALMTLNQPDFLECARALALRTLADGGKTDDDRLVYAFRRCVARKPAADELASLRTLLIKEEGRFAAADAKPWELAAEDPANPPKLPDGATPAQAAAWTVVSRVLLNLDETITKEQRAMPIHVTCPGCDAEYALSDRQAGKKVRCKKCEAIITVEAAPTTEAPAPERPAASSLLSEPPRQDSKPRIPTRIPDRPRRARDEEDETHAPPIRKSGGGLVITLILGGLGLFVVAVLACGGLGAYFLLAGSASAPPPVAMTAKPIVKENPAPPPNLAPPAQAPQPDPQPKPQPIPPVNPQANPVVPPPVVVVPPPVPVLPPPPPPAEPLKPVVWKVQPDPLPATMTLPDNSQGEIPAAGFSHQVVFPTSPSPFVGVGAGDGFNTNREVWDLRSMKRVGVVPGGGGDPAVSPDGVYVATGALAPKPTVDVWTVADGGNVKVAVGDGFLKGVDFAGPGQLLTSKMAGLDTQVDVWDIKTGKSVCQVKAVGDGDPKKWAFSAGRKYLAVPRKDFVVIYDLATGEPAGDLATTGDCQGLAFSTDGKAVAGLFGAGFGGGGSRLQVWDAATGKSIATHTPEKSADNAFFYQGRPLEWLPDGSGWVLHGQLLADGQSGKTYWNVPAEALDGNPRRVFAGGRVAHVKKGDGQKLSLVLEAMPADKLAAALAAVRKGEDPGATALPPAKAADWSAAKELSAPAGAAEWKAGADSAAAPKGALGARPIPLTGKGADVVRLLFSRPDVGQAVVLTAANPSALVDQKQVHFDRYDLAGGQRLGGADLFTAEFPKGKPPALDVDLSPDGALLAVREPKGGKRIDVWATADGKHVVGWLPYEKGGDASIRWFAFTDEKHLLTLSGAGALALWDAPECKAEYSISFVRDVPALSPGRKYLAAFTGSNFEVLETATGARAGQLFGPNPLAVLAAAYRPDGKEFAAVVTTADGPRLAHWDATTGAAKGDFGLAPGGGDLEWCGTEHLLFGPTLIDLSLKWATTQYNLPGAGRQSPAGPDGRHWFAFSRNPNDPPLLTAQTLPDDATLQLAKQVAAGQVQTVLAPGMAVNVRVQGGGPDMGADDYHRDLVTRQTQRLQALGFKAAPDAPLTLTFQIQPARDTGKIRRYETLGGFPRRELDIHVIEVEVEGTLKDAQGGVLWTQKTSTFTPDTFGIVRAEDLQGSLNKEVWNRVAGWTGGVGPATVLVRGPGGVEALPRPVILAGDR